MAAVAVGRRVPARVPAQRSAANIRSILALALHSRGVVKRLRRQLRLEYDCVERGILHLYTDRREFEASLAPAALMRALGCNRRSLTPQQAIELEPALARSATASLARTTVPRTSPATRTCSRSNWRRAAPTRGVQFLFGTTIDSLRVEHGQARGAAVRASDGSRRELPADALVVCLGVHSASLLRPLGLRLLIYPGKGYSATFDIVAPERAPSVSLTDDEYKLVFSRLGRRLRVAGTAEIAGWSLDLNERRCAALTRRTQELFPAACDYTQPTYWAGLRPVTPSNIPYLGATRVRGLFLNTGHGTLGWTLGPGNGELIAQVVSGRAPSVALPSGL